MAHALPHQQQQQIQKEIFPKGMLIFVMITRLFDQGQPFKTNSMVALSVYCPFCGRKLAAWGEAVKSVFVQKPRPPTWQCWRHIADTYEGVTFTHLNLA